MRITLRSLVSLLFLGAIGATAGCSAQESTSSSYDNGGAPPSTSPSPGEPSPGGDTGGGAARAIAEADIIQLDGGRLYAMSKSGTVSVVDVSSPGRLALLGQTRIAGEPFEMYRRGDLLVTMTNRAVSPSGATYTTGDERTTVDAGAGAAVIVLDVSDPSSIRHVAASRVPGEIADSRIVGNVLYLATYENARCYQCGPRPRTMVTSFDVTRPNDLTRVDQLAFQSNAPEGFNLPWGSSWKRSIFVTNERLYIGGHADIEPSTLQQNASDEGIIDVIDVTDPGGHLNAGAHLKVAGALLSRWQIDERGGILRVISQRGAGRTANGIGMPAVDTFTIESTQSFVPLGHTSLKLPRQEGLRTVRFDGDRAYAITYNQTDPLFVIDLADPAAPLQRGELHMPGFMFHLEPHGSRVLGLGVDRTDPAGSLNVSLFDVADMDQPRMVKRVSFGMTGLHEDYQILNYEVPEDQDRIQKAFRVLDGGLVVVPYSTGRASGAYYGSSGSSGSTSGATTGGAVDSCTGVTGAVQLVQWTGDTLTKLANLPTRGNARRAFLGEGELLTVSDSNVTAFSLARRDVAVQTADVEIGECVARTLPSSGPRVPSNNGGYHGSSGYGYSPRYGSSSDYRHCAVGAVGAGGAGGVSGVSGAWAALAALIALGVAAKRRQRG